MVVVGAGLRGPCAYREWRQCAEQWCERHSVRGLTRWCVVADTNAGSEHQQTFETLMLRNQAAATKAAEGEAAAIKAAEEEAATIKAAEEEAATTKGAEEEAAATKAAEEEAAATKAAEEETAATKAAEEEAAATKAAEEETTKAAEEESAAEPEIYQAEAEQNVVVATIRSAGTAPDFAHYADAAQANGLDLQVRPRSSLLCPFNVCWQVLQGYYKDDPTLELLLKDLEVHTTTSTKSINAV